MDKNQKQTKKIVAEVISEICQKPCLEQCSEPCQETSSESKFKSNKKRAVKKNNVGNVNIENDNVKVESLENNNIKDESLENNNVENKKKSNAPKKTRQSKQPQILSENDSNLSDEENDSNLSDEEKVITIPNNIRTITTKSNGTATKSNGRNTKESKEKPIKIDSIEMNMEQIPELEDVIAFFNTHKLDNGLYRMVEAYKKINKSNTLDKKYQDCLKEMSYQMKIKISLLIELSNFFNCTKWFDFMEAVLSIPIILINANIKIFENINYTLNSKKNKIIENSLLNGTNMLCGIDIKNFITKETFDSTYDFPEINQEIIYNSILNIYLTWIGFIFNIKIGNNIKDNNIEYFNNTEAFEKYIIKFKELFSLVNNDTSNAIIKEKLLCLKKKSGTKNNITTSRSEQVNNAIENEKVEVMKKSIVKNNFNNKDVCAEFLEELDINDSNHTEEESEDEAEETVENVTF